MSSLNRERFLFFILNYFDVYDHMFSVSALYSISIVCNLNRSICSRLQFRLRLSRVDRRDHYIPNDFFFLLRCCSRSFANRTCTRLSSHYCCRKRKLTWKIVIGIEKSHPPVILKPRVFPIPWNSSRLSELPLVADMVGACFSILNVTWGIVVDYFYRKRLHNIFHFNTSFTQLRFSYIHRHGKTIPANWIINWINNFLITFRQARCQNLNL